MDFKIFYQNFCLTFLVWLSMMLMINCTPVNDGLHKASASKERMNHLEAAELSILAGKIAKDGKKEAQIDGHEHFRDVYSALKKNAGRDTSFHISKVNKIGTPGKKARVNDMAMHRHLGESNMLAGRIAKESKIEAQRIGDEYYKQSFSGLSKMSGRMAAFHISKTNKSVQPAPIQASS